MERTVSCLWNEPNAPHGYRTGISLHSHTNHSHESLDFIGTFIDRRPLLKRWLSGEKRRAVKTTATPVDLANAYWTPPLSPIAAFRLETAQIESTLGMSRSFVSISDHDTIAAPMALHVVPEGRSAPISVEWTVPFGGAIFHMGVHNLPIDQAEAVMRSLAEYTATPRRARLTELLEWLDAQRDVLVILNHPYWDLAGIGAERHAHALTALLAEEGECIHALELSGIRSWRENVATCRLAESFNQMTVSGGDRHGVEPNASLNLTHAETFEEFVHEIRRERRGHTLFMPQYQQSTMLRNFETVLSVVRDYPDFPTGSQRWDERVFHPDREGEIRPLQSLWQRPPAYITGFFSALSLLEVELVQRILRTTFRQPKERFAAFAGEGEIAR